MSLWAFYLILKLIFWIFILKSMFSSRHYKVEVSPHNKWVAAPFNTCACQKKKKSDFKEFTSQLLFVIDDYQMLILSLLFTYSLNNHVSTYSGQAEMGSEQCHRWRTRGPQKMTNVSDHLSSSLPSEPLVRGLISFSGFFQTALLRYNWYTRNYTCLMGTAGWIWTYTNTRETFITIKRTDISITSQSFLVSLCFCLLVCFLRG